MMGGMYSPETFDNPTGEDPMDNLSQITLLDAARQWFGHCARSPRFTREARNKALGLERQCEDELGRVAARMAGHSLGVGLTADARSVIMCAAIEGAVPLAA